MDIICVTPETFDTLQVEWNELLGRSASDNVFLRWEWIHTWWTVFKGRKRLFILTARRDGRLVGIAPFYIEQEGPLGIKTIRLCSEELSPDYMDIIAEKDQEAEIAQEIVKALAWRAKEWDVLILNNLRTESVFLTEAALFHEYSHEIAVTQHCPFIKIQGTFEDYYQSRTELRHFSLKKKLKILLDDKKIVRQIVTEESLVQGLEDLFLLHAKRAKSKNIHSNFLSPDVKRFHQELSRQFFQEGILHLELLYDGSAAISGAYAFHYKNKAYVYQLGFDPQWAKWSAGGVMLLLGVENAFQIGLQEFDLLKRDGTLQKAVDR